MSPRIIQLPLSGRDRRHYVRELRLYGESDSIFYDCPAISMICITTAKLLRPCTITVSQVELKR